ncbi:MAG: hypothetical protein Q8M06_03745 [Methanobacteriaceae archaeon]|nr:hypothetical protein [Methanobacteriaceae archaeon]
MKKCDKCGKDVSDQLSQLKYKQPLIGHFTDEMDPFNELTICPECSQEDNEIERDASKKNKSRNKSKEAVDSGNKAQASINKKK